MSYGYKTGFFLEALENLGKINAQIIDAFLSGHHSSYKKLRRMAKYGPFYEELFIKPKKLSYEDYKKLEKQRFYKLMSYLQKQGLVKKNKEGYRKDSFWEITKKGSNRLKELKEASVQKPLNNFYNREKGSELKIIIFDIPEEEKKKRVWIRDTLISLGFSMLQKSVWMGNYKLPTEFIKDIEGLGMLPYVHIFSVNKTGTLK